jgi:MoxR-like ATPase
MQEHQVTAGGKRHRLPDPFFVLATQNPIEQEGTYPLPEAQLDRFMFEVLVDYPSEEEEFEIVRQTTVETVAGVEKILSREEVKSLQSIVRRIPAADHVIQYAMQFARLTRHASSPPLQKGGPGRVTPATDIPDFIAEYVSWGAGPRASQFLVLGAKARAALHGRTYVSTDDVRAVARPVLRHRIITNFNAEAEGLTPDHIIERLIEVIPSDPSEARLRGLPPVFKAAEAG